MWATKPTHRAALHYERVGWTPAEPVVAGTAPHRRLLATGPRVSGTTPLGTLAPAHTVQVAPHMLILVRHAKSDWSGHEGDHDRPLAERGRRQAPDAGRWLAGNVGSMDLAVVSTAKRARDTWDLVSEQLDQSPSTRYDHGVYGASADDLLDIVRSLDEARGTVVLVGHNPGIEDLAETLTGDHVSMPTSALAVIELPSAWDGAGRVPGRVRAAGRPPTPVG